MKYFTEYLEEFTNPIYEKFGAFYAFTKKQFDENKLEGVTYVQIPGGLICPKDIVKDFQIEMSKGYDKALNKDIKENTPKKIIRREYFNYEAHIDGDTDRVWETLEKYKTHSPDLFTDEFITKTIRKAYRDAVRYDWF